MTPRRFKTYVAFEHNGTQYTANGVYQATTEALAAVVQQRVDHREAKWIGTLTFGRVGGRGIVGGH